MVSQEPILFPGTIRENICFGVGAAAVSEEEVVGAAKAAHADAFIRSLKDGYGARAGGGGGGSLRSLDDDDG